MEESRINAKAALFFQNEGDSLYFKDWCDAKTFEEAVKRQDQFCTKYEGKFRIQMKYQDEQNLKNRLQGEGGFAYLYGIPTVD